MTDSEISGSPANPAPWARDLLLLAVVFGGLYFFLLGRAPLGNPDEGRYAEIPREMIASGDWVTPRLDGVNYFEKPALGYWAVAGCLKLFGPSEASARAMPACFGVAGVLLAYAAGRRLYGRSAGLVSAFVLGTTLFYMANTRILILDLMVAVLMSAALFCFIIGVGEPPGARRRFIFYGLYASAALATMTKGLIGFLLTGAVMFLWLLLLGQWKRLRPFYLPTGGLLFLAVAAPWHVLANARNPGWAHFYFVYEQWQRFLTTSGHGRYGPWWYFIPAVLLGLFPWVGFLWAAVREALGGGWARRGEAAAAWFLAIWAGFIFLFFSASQSKLYPYILPVFPPLAVLIGAWLARRLAEGATARLRGGLRVYSLLCGVLAAAICAVVARPGLARMDPAQAAELQPFALKAAVVLALGGIAAQALARRAGAALASLVVTMALFFSVLAFAYPAIQKPGTKELALEVKELAQPGDRIFHYHGFFHDFAFYSGHEFGTVDFHGDDFELQNDAAARASGRFIDDARFRREWEGPGRIFVVARKRDITELFADPAFHKHLLAITRDYYLFSNYP